MDTKIDITKASMEQLKVWAYDIIITIQNHQNTLNQVQNEIAKREISAQQNNVSEKK